MHQLSHDKCPAYSVLTNCFRTSRENLATSWQDRVGCEGPWTGGVCQKYPFHDLSRTVFQIWCQNSRTEDCCIYNANMNYIELCRLNNVCLLEVNTGWLAIKCICHGTLWLYRARSGLSRVVTFLIIVRVKHQHGPTPSICNHWPPLHWAPLQIFISSLPGPAGPAGMERLTDS